MWDIGILRHLPKIKFCIRLDLDCRILLFRASVCRRKGRAYGLCEGNSENTGTKPGKEVLEVYAKAPQGVLDTPVRVLCGFAKTKELAAGEEEHITLEIPKIHLPPMMTVV